MDWVEGWMGIVVVEVGRQTEQVRTQTSFIGLEVVALQSSKFD